MCLYFEYIHISATVWNSSWRILSDRVVSPARICITSWTSEDSVLWELMLCHWVISSFVLRITLGLLGAEDQGLQSIQKVGTNFPSNTAVCPGRSESSATWLSEPQILHWTSIVHCVKKCLVCVFWEDHVNVDIFGVNLHIRLEERTIVRLLLIWNAC